MRQDSDFCALCREFGISRKTGYKWKERFLRNGMSGLCDRSRRPETSPNQLDEDQVCQIIRLKQAHPHWGPRKIREVFARQLSAALVPSDSTFKRVLDPPGRTALRCRPGRYAGNLSVSGSISFIAHRGVVIINGPLVGQHRALRARRFRV
jgi:hypothetical protein